MQVFLPSTSPALTSICARKDSALPVCDQRPYSHRPPLLPTNSNPSASQPLRLPLPIARLNHQLKGDFSPTNLVIRGNLSVKPPALGVSNPLKLRQNTHPHPSTPRRSHSNRNHINTARHLGSSPQTHKAAKKAPSRLPPHRCQTAIFTLIAGGLMASAHKKPEKTRFSAIFLTAV